MTSKTTELPQVQLGRNGPIIGAQGLGCMGMSEFYGPTNEGQARATLERALELGVTMFDTADMYGLGANEEFLGPFIRPHRDRIVIATKFGYSRSASNPDDWSLDNRPEHIRAAVDRSLKRLGIDTIDLYYMHRRNPDVPLQESVGAMAELVTAGKVRHLGLSEVSAEELWAAHAIHPIAALQSEWSLFTRGIEACIVPVAAELGVAIVPYAPLGRGLLTGKLLPETLADDDARKTFPRFATANSADNQALVTIIREAAAARDITAAQLALAWVHDRARAHGVTVVPIPGTRRVERLEENIAAAALTLSASELALLEPIAAAVKGIAI